MNPGGTHHCRRIGCLRLGIATRRSPSSSSRLLHTAPPSPSPSLHLTLDMIGNERLAVLMMSAVEARHRYGTYPRSTAAVRRRQSTSLPVRLHFSLSPAGVPACYVLPSFLPSFLRFGCCFGLYNLEKLIKSCFLLALPTTTAEPTTNTEQERGKRE